MTEQEVVNKFYPDDNTKTISDVITELNKININDSNSIKTLKEYFPMEYYIKLRIPVTGILCMSLYLISGTAMTTY